MMISPSEGCVVLSGEQCLDGADAWEGVITVLLLQSGPAGVMFLSEEHAHRFWTAWSQLGERSDDTDAALLYGLTAFLDLWREAQVAGVVRDGSVCWLAVSEMLSEVPSVMLSEASYERLVLLSWLLGLGAASEESMQPMALMVLNEQRFVVAVQALLIRRYGLSALVGKGDRG